MGFEKLERIMELEVDYKTLGALAIHSSKDAPFETTDSAVVKIGGKPVIPGSSLKGVIRSTLEAMLSAEGVNVCVPMAAIPKAPKKDDGSFKDNYLKSIGRKQPCSVSNPCPVCEIFGTTAGKQGLSGRAIFLDAKPDGDVSVIERNHVAIMRDTRSQAGGKLMSPQAVDAGAKFTGTVRVFNYSDWHIGALINGIKAISLVGLGAKKTSGYGEVSVTISSLKDKTLKNGHWEEEEKAAEKTYTDAYIKKILENKKK